jgi:hypothetical protein
MHRLLILPSVFLALFGAGCEMTNGSIENGTGKKIYLTMRFGADSGYGEVDSAGAISFKRKVEDLSSIEYLIAGRNARLARAKLPGCGVGRRKGIAA